MKKNILFVEIPVNLATLVIFRKCYVTFCQIFTGVEMPSRHLEKASSQNVHNKETQEGGNLRHNLRSVHPSQVHVTHMLGTWIVSEAT